MPLTRILVSGLFLFAFPVLGPLNHMALAFDDELWTHDRGLTGRVQEFHANRYRKGRTLVTVDFDGDGLVDYFVGNAGDHSSVFRNLGSGASGAVEFAPAQVLLEDAIAFAAGAADYDDDGDLDLFVACGGREGSEPDYLFRNDSTPGEIRFTDVSRRAGVDGPTPNGVRLPLARSLRRGRTTTETETRICSSPSTAAMAAPRTTSYGGTGAMGLSRTRRFSRI